MAVLLLGKAGGRETMAGSDLDLVLLYDHAAEATEFDGGARSLPASQWFVRAAHAFVAAITASGADGQLYAVDMRLRPSGNKGPVAVSLSAFHRYHQADAWTWERMALTRARVVAGPPDLRHRAEAAIAEAIEGADASRARADAAAMRARMARDLPADGPWDVKLRAGGLVEVEFIAQVLQLVHTSVARSPTTRIALANLAAAGFLRQDDAGLLIRAGHLFRTVQGMLRLTLGRSPPGRLARGVGAVRCCVPPTRLTCPPCAPLSTRPPSTSARPSPVTSERSRHEPARRRPRARLTMEATGGRHVSLAGLRGRPFVLYFYPKADTPGCTKEACAFQEALPQLGKLGIDVIGVSRDKMAALEKFAAKYGLTFPLASDAEGNVSDAFATWVEKSMYGRAYMGMERARS